LSASAWPLHADLERLEREVATDAVSEIVDVGRILERPELPDRFIDLDDALAIRLPRGEVLADVVSRSRALGFGEQLDRGWLLGRRSEVNRELLRTHSVRLGIASRRISWMRGLWRLLSRENDYFGRRSG
jgi:hypothetical protein